MEIIGHKKQLEFLKKAADSGKISHAYLFSGQEKLGKKIIAFEWISTIFGEDLHQKQHPDLIFIKPEKSEENKDKETGKEEIRVSQIKDLIQKLSLKPHSAPLKAVIIDQAHMMNSESQTALLKTLEEPKGATLLILISQMPDSLFPTIRSRTENIKFYSVEKDEIKEYLEKHGVSENNSEEICKISQGRPGVAVDFIDNSEQMNVLLERVKELDKISNSGISLRFQYAKDLSQNEETLKEILDIWLSYFRNILLGVINNRQSEDGGNKKYSFNRIKSIIKLIQNTKFLISTTNVNTRLVLEILMLEF